MEAGELAKLRDVFSQHPPEVVESLLKEHGFEKALSFLVDDVKYRLSCGFTIKVGSGCGSQL